jgi:hypothetical protein
MADERDAPADVPAPPPEPDAPDAPGAEEFETLQLVADEWDGELARDSADYIRWVQAALNRVSGAGLVVDGISGTLTRAAVRSFQSRQRLAVDGIVGPLTEAALLRAGASPLPGGAVPANPRPPSRAPSAAPRPAPRPAPGTAPTAGAVPESVLTALLPAFVPYRYANNVFYPWALPGVSLPQAPPHQIDCCTFVEALTVGAWAKHRGTSFQWSSARHAQMMIMGTDLYSPVAAMVESGMATAVPAGQPPTAWCVGQGWGSSSGHTFIIVARHAPSDRVLTLEANKAYGLDGVGCRRFGNLSQLPGGRPPARWWEDPAAPTWSEMLAFYSKGVKLAKLNVANPVWAGLTG